ncbi:NADPH oxidase [Cylindrobasidium torrendii FP15055 ss-10]|uniref:NADPH oxidase n=1 Tax=Cylindrobasidium torrendii FP15055 ss-10 TaxID=1314674 RepID=A0A0D7BIH0_9AGAR|nr:NADPH oxidase [Cylindrobasidium torrendii FP15055 ss-10]
MMNAFKRSSGFDFLDRGGKGWVNLQEHPDMNPDKGNTPTYLQRNKTERNRLQGLQRSLTVAAPKVAAPRGWQQRYEVWMINDGGRHMFFGLFIFLHMLVFALGFMHYQLKDSSSKARAAFGVTFPIARTSALVLHVDVIFILLPVCRNFVSLLRRTPLNDIIPFDKNLLLHKATAWSIVFFTFAHVGAHVINVVWLVLAIPNATPGQRALQFLLTNLITGPGLTGWIMNVCLGVMVWFAMEKRKRANFERFWYTHHLFIVFFINWQLHGMFCMIKPDRPPYCSFNTIGVFWRYWLVGGLIWIWERILREIRSRHVTYISKVIQHPSNVMEVQIKKEKTTTRAGQYIFLSCPEVSYFQWHPFTLTSAPEEDYISVHIRVAGDFTTAFAKACGCNFGDKDKEKDAKNGGLVVGTNTNPPINRTLPRVMVDGPFGSASEDFLKYDTVLLVGAGIGVTPFASILKSVWYRMNNFGNAKPTRLSKVYFTWVIRDYGTAEWFHSLLAAIEEQDTQNRIEINIYLTAKIKEDDMNNIIVQDVGAEKDAISGLRAPTHFGRPNWDRVFPGIAAKHPETDVGVFFCGPPALSKSLHLMCTKYSDPASTRFFFGKENF